MNASTIWQMQNNSFSADFQFSTRKKKSNHKLIDYICKNWHLKIDLTNRILFYRFCWTNLTVCQFLFSFLRNKIKKKREKCQKMLSNLYGDDEICAECCGFMVFFGRCCQYRLHRRFITHVFIIINEVVIFLSFFMMTLCVCDHLSQYFSTVICNREPPSIYIILRINKLSCWFNKLDEIEWV